MDWIYLFIAGIFEIAWAVGLKYSQGMTRFWPSLTTFILMIASFVFLALAVRHIPLGTGYAIWTGIGVAGTAILGVLLFAEPVNMMRVLCLLLIFLGIIGLKISNPY
jgi:quaternary ammonium compound-resistance protein SugE